MCCGRKLGPHVFISAEKLCVKGYYVEKGVLGAGDQTSVANGERALLLCWAQLNKSYPALRPPNSLHTH